MLWLQTLDTELFRWINQGLANPLFDAVMPFASGSPLAKATFFPVVGLLAIWLACKGGARGILCVAMSVVVLSVGDGVICRAIKHAVARPRPFAALAEVRRPDRAAAPGSPAVDSGFGTVSLPPAHAKEWRAEGLIMSNSASMPSSHAANWFSVGMVAFIYYRRTIWLSLPAAVLVGFSRIYNGVHYPSDVAAGAILGGGYAVALVWSLAAAWQWAGRKWFPIWWARLPLLIGPGVRVLPEDDEPVRPPRQRGRAEAGFEPPHASVDQHWMRLAFLWILVILLARLGYLASGTIQLCEDESYQWLWSKHLALSYYSKPPLIAYAQFLGTAIWGDSAFGVRFLSPVITAVLSLVVVRFFAREVNARAGFFLVLILTAVPLVSAGAVLMTVDALSVLFWTLAMLAGWRAVQEGGSTRDWFWVGLWMGLGFLSKYTQLFQWLCWAVFFALWPPARRHLRRPGPYLAWLVNLLCATPVLVWNARHDWITVAHVAGDAKAGQPWEPSLRFPLEFLGAEFGLLNPVFFIGMTWAAIAFWRRGRNRPLLIYFFSMGAPLFLAYLVFTVHSRVLPNWIAPSVLPLFCLMASYWDTEWRLGKAAVRRWLVAGLSLGFSMVVLGYDTDLAGKLIGRQLPVKLDILHRVRQWDEAARVVGGVRQELLAEGKPVFIIAGHYGLAGELSFYLPEAKAAVRELPLVFCLTESSPRSQFYFWPGYLGRKGESAVFVQELDRDHPDAAAAPAQLTAEFESVTDLGVHDVFYHGYLLRPLQIFACRGLK